MIRAFCLLVATVPLWGSGCRVLSPVPIEAREQYIASDLIDSESPQVEIGQPHKILDGVGWVVGIPSKILLWDRRIDRHKISEPTLITLADYLEFNQLAHVKVRANQYAPLKDFHRLRQNTAVAWPYRYSLGLLSLARETILPGRVFGGDHFNPYTQTVHLYSDVPAIALHEAAHAKDSTRRKYQGTYALAYTLFPIWHETVATEDVFAYLDVQGSGREVAAATRILYPAYGSHVGSFVGGFFPATSLPIYLGGIGLGHINGHALSNSGQFDRSSAHQVAGFRADHEGEIDAHRSAKDLAPILQETDEAIRQVSFEQ